MTDGHMREPWQGFARTLQVALVVAALVAIPATLYASFAASADDPAAVVARWYAGAPEDAAGAGPPVAPDERLLSDPLELARLGMVALLVIPILAYVVLTAGYLRHRRWAYLVMGVVQLGILLSAALGLV